MQVYNYEYMHFSNLPVSIFFRYKMVVYSLCLVSTLSTVGFSLHLQMASFLSAVTGSYECLS